MVAVLGAHLSDEDEGARGMVAECLGKLAAAVAPMAVTTLVFAWKGRFDKHRRLARWTLPIWLYVSVTGVVVYLMLYHL